MKGIATHIDPESCVGTRKGIGEALTGARTGNPLSRDILHFGVPTPWRQAKGKTGRIAIA